MMSIVKIATININGITSSIRIDMLKDFLHRQDIDICFIQEITDHENLQISGYHSLINIGTEHRGTAFLTRDTIRLANYMTTPTGRAMAADFNGIRLINIYAPSGSAHRLKQTSIKLKKQ
jgi:exonuclease III